MPRIRQQERTPGIRTEAVAENPTSLIEQKNALLDRVEASMAELSRDEVLKIAARVFEHSVEDGLKLADRLRMTPEEIFDIVDTFHFIEKHQGVVDFLTADTSNNLNRELVDKGKISRLHDFRIKLVALGNFDKKPAGMWMPYTPDVIEKRFREEQKQASHSDLAQAVDDFYSQFLTSREFRPVEEKDTRTKGEGMAETVLGKIERALTGQYYTGSVRKILEAVLAGRGGKTQEIRSELLDGDNFITRPDVEKLCKKLKLDIAKLEDRLKGALYAPAMVGMERQVTKQELSRELNKDLTPRGLKVELDRKKDKYEVVKIEGEENKEKVGEWKLVAELPKGIQSYSSPEHFYVKDQVSFINERGKILSTDDTASKVFEVPSSPQQNLKYYESGKNDHRGKSNFYYYSKDKNQYFESEELEIVGYTPIKVGDDLCFLVRDNGGNQCIWKSSGELIITKVTKDCDRFCCAQGKFYLSDGRGIYDTDGHNLAERLGYDRIGTMVTLRGDVYFQGFNKKTMKKPVIAKINEGQISDDDGGTTYLVKKFGENVYYARGDSEPVVMDVNKNIIAKLKHPIDDYIVVDGKVFEFSGHWYSSPVSIRDVEGNNYGPAFEDVRRLWEEDGRLMICGDVGDGHIQTVSVKVSEKGKETGVEKREKPGEVTIKSYKELGYAGAYFFENGDTYFLTEREDGITKIINEQGNTLFETKTDKNIDFGGARIYLQGDKEPYFFIARVGENGLESVYINSKGEELSTKEIYDLKQAGKAAADYTTSKSELIFVGKDKVKQDIIDSAPGYVLEYSPKERRVYITDEEGKRYGPGFGMIEGVTRRGNEFIIAGDLGNHSAHDYAVAHINIEEQIGISDDEQAKLDLLNLVHKPQSEQIEEYFAQQAEERGEGNLSAKQKLKKAIGTSGAVAVTLSQMVKEATGLFIDTITAKKDRMSHLLARKLAEKMFPGQFKDKTKDYRGWGGYSGMDAMPKMPNAGPEAYLNPSDSFELSGGDSEGMSDTREIMSFRDEVNSLVVSGLYGNFSGGRWSKSHFSLVPSVSGLAQETTATLPSVKGRREVSLPKPLEAKYIPSRIMGLDKNGKQIPLEITTNSLGEAKVIIPKGVEQVVYSMEIDPAVLPMANVSAEENAKFQKQFGTEMRSEIASLPEELEMFVDSIKTLPPKQQVIAIENFVRQTGYYDFDNGEVSGLKRGKPIEEQMYVMQERLEELRSKKPELAEELKGKQFAGVCADFALLSASLLRRAGFASGIAAGFVPEGKVVRVRDAHAVAFVVWPDELGNNRVATVDGTPGGRGMEGITMPSIAEREEKQAEEIEKMSEEMDRQFREILETIDNGDAEAIRGLQNGKLEQVLNAILRHKVKQPHLEALKGMLGSYWYTPLSRIDFTSLSPDDPRNMENRKSIVNFMESSLKQTRQEHAGADVEKPAGKELLEMMEDYARKFIRGGKAKDYNDAFKVLNDILDFVKNSLSDTEYKAAVAVVHYLRAVKMKN